MSFVVIFILVFSLFVLGVGMKSSFSQSKDEKAVTSQKISNSSRVEIEDMLKQIETKKAPAERMGAMCYKPVMSSGYQEYVCPIDGEKTVYGQKNGSICWMADSIVEMRRLVGKINSVTDLADFGLDERRLCSKCFPDLKSEDRYVSLITRYPDGREHVYSKVSADDLRILVGFFEKKLNYESAVGQEIPLKKEIGRIRKVLGAEIEKKFKRR